MPGNEYGERIHNFFGQESLSQDHHQSQVVDASWSSFSNGLVNQRHIDPSIINNLKSYSTQQPAYSVDAAGDLNVACLLIPVDPERWQSSNSHQGLNFTIRPEYSRSLLQDNQYLTNGHGMAMQNGSNVLGVDTESSRDKSSVRGFTPEVHKSPMRFEMGESPVNYDFFGGQQQLNSQLPGMLQPFPRQQMTFNDMQLLKQQVMAKQMHDYQLQQQLHNKQLEARQLSSLNSNAVNGNRSSDNQSHLLINGIPLQNASSNCWQPDLLTGNTNWMHRGISPVVQGSSNGLGTEHGQANLQFEPSLYGMPLGGAMAPKSSFSSVQMDRIASQHGSSPTNQPTSFMNKGDEKAMFSNPSAPGSDNRPNFESFQQDDPRQRHISAQEKLDQMEGSGPPEKSHIKVPENVSGSQKTTSLDPTEEKILFGSDDNLWEAFGNGTDMSLTGNLMSNSSDMNDACPSLKTGGWSALMLSAVAETSSNDAGFGNRVQNLGVKASNAVAPLKGLARHCSNAISERLQSDSCSIQTNVGIEDRFGIWKAASKPNLVAPVEQKNHFTQNLQMKANYGFGIASAENKSTASRDVQENQQHLGNNSVEKATPQVIEMAYHPMGNIGVTDEPYREKVSHLPPTLERVSAGDQEHFGQSKSHSQPPMNMQIDRGHVSQGMGSENSPSTSASADRSVDTCYQVKNASRQTMLELLHKVDQPEEHSVETNVSSIPESTPSAENGGQFRHSQSSASQWFSLQLAPPSQPAPSPDNMQFSMNFLQPLDSLHTAPGKVPTSESRFAPWASNQSSPQQSTSGFPYSKGYHQNQLMPGATRQLTSTHLISSSSELSTPQVKERDECSGFEQRGNSAQTPSLLNPTTHNNKADSAEGFSVLSAPQPQVGSSSPQQSSSSGMRSDSRAGISSPQHRFWNQPPKPQPDILRPHPFPKSHVEESFSRQDKRNQLSSQNGGEMSLSGRGLVNMHEFQDNDMGAKQTSGVASMFSKMVQSNHQTFDHSLPSNNLSKDNVRHNEHMAGSGDGDAPKMTVKRVEDSSVHLQKLARKGEQQSPSRSGSLLRDGLNHKESANHMQHLGQTFSQSVSDKNHSASGADHQQISPQMAPSWYSQYGTFKNGLKMSGSAPGAGIPSSESLPHGSTDELLNVVKPKKRKTATSELLSWNKQFMQGLQRLKTLSEAEVDWVRATNRFAEKVEFETLLEDSPPIKSKRSLYTTRLMQQLFCPPPARVISLIASSNYEFVAYTAARAALGDACSSTSTDRNELSERRKAEPISDQYISKAAEDFVSRSQKLETNFAGLQNGTTITDLSIEVQDLEKFAVINRFAKFNPTSSSTDRTMSSLRLNPQRYVTIAPMPRNIPDGVQRLSL
ncbi:hypothetical protein Bca4012_024553 [Brassica carinata]